MPIINVPGVGPVKFRDDLSDDEYKDQYRRIMDMHSARPQASFLQSYGEGLSTLADLPAATKYLASPTNENRKALLGDSSQYGSTSFDDVRKQFSGQGFGAGLSALGDYIPQLAGQSLGAITVPAAAGLVTRSPAAFAGVSSAQYAVTNAKAQAQEAERLAKEGQQIPEPELWKIAGSAAGQAALDVAGFSLGVPGLGRLIGLGGKEAAEKTAKQVLESTATGSTLGAVGKGVAKGVAFEMPQEVAQQALERYAAGQNLTDEDARKSYLEAAVGAGILGGPMGAVSGVAERGQARQALENLNTGVSNEQSIQQVQQPASPEVTDNGQAQQSTLLPDPEQLQAQPTELPNEQVQQPVGIVPQVAPQAEPTAPVESTAPSISETPELTDAQIAEQIPPEWADDIESETVPEVPTAPAASQATVPELPTAPALKVPTAPEAPAGIYDFTLPQQLQGAKPRFNFGLKQFTPEFSNDLDKAAFITAQPKPSKFDALYVKAVEETTGIPEAELRSYGQQVRDQVKTMAKTDAPGSTLVVPDMRERLAALPQATPQPVLEVPAVPAPVSIAEQVGLPKSSAVTKRINLLDPTVPEQAQQIRQELQKYATYSGIKPEIKQNIAAYLGSTEDVGQPAIAGQPVTELRDKDGQGQFDFTPTSVDVPRRSNGNGELAGAITQPTSGTVATTEGTARPDDAGTQGVAGALAEPTALPEAQPTAPPLPKTPQAVSRDTERRIDAEATKAEEERARRDSFVSVANLVGLPKISATRKRIRSLDPAVPEQAQVIKQELQEYLKVPGIKPNVERSIVGYLERVEGTENARQPVVQATTAAAPEVQPTARRPATSLTDKEVEQILRKPASDLSDPEVMAALGRVNQKTEDGFIKSDVAQLRGDIKAGTPDALTKAREWLDTTGRPTYESENVGKLLYRDADSAISSGALKSENIQKMLDDFSSQATNPPVFRVAQSIDQVPTPIRDQMVRDGATGAKGFYTKNGQTPEVWIIADNNKNANDAQKTMVHETVGHYGLRSVLGDNYESTMQNALKNEMVKGMVASNTTQEAEEAIARIAERAIDGNLPLPARGVLNRVVEMVRNGMRRLGFKLKLSDNEIYRLLADSRAYVVDGKGGSALTKSDTAYRRGEQVADKIYATAQSKFNPATAKAVSTAVEILENAPRGMRQIGLKLGNLAAIADAFKKSFPEISDINIAINERNGDGVKAKESIAPIVQAGIEYAGKFPQEYKVFGEFANEATITQINPTRPRSFYEPKRGRQPTPNQQERLNKYDDLRKRYDALRPEAKKLYGDMINTSNKLMNDFVTAIDAQVTEAIERAARRDINGEITNTGHMPIMSRIRQVLSGTSYYVQYIDSGKTERTMTYSGSAERDEGIQFLKDQGAQVMGTGEFSTKMLDPYSALRRYGKYKLDFINADGERVIQSFETMAERRAAQDLATAGKGADLKVYEQSAQNQIKEMPPSSFIAQTYAQLTSVMEASGMSVEEQNTVREDFAQAVLAALPQAGAYKALRKRKGYLGASSDVVRAFADSTNVMSRNIANINFNRKVKPLEDAVNERADQRTLDEKTGQLYDDVRNEVNTHLRNARQPQDSALSNFASATSYYMMMGANASSAIVETLQTASVTAPMLYGKFGFSESAKALKDAMALFVGSGTTRSVETPVGEKVEVKDNIFTRSVSNYDLTSPKLKHLAPLMNRMEAQGLVRSSLIQEVANAAMKDTANSNSGMAKVMRVVSTAMGGMFHLTSQFNREVAAIAHYNLELGKIKGTPTDVQMETAAQNAIRFAELTQGQATRDTAPSIAHGPVGKVAFTFKRYASTMMYILGDTMRRAWADPSLTKEEKGIARRQLAGIYGAAALVSGTMGLPLMGMVEMIANALFGDEDEPYDFRTEMVNGLGGMLALGPLSMLTQTDFESRVSWNGLLFRETNLGRDANAVDQMLATLGGPFLGVLRNMNNGLKDIGRGNIERGIEQMVPSVVRNQMQAVRFAVDGVRTRDDQEILGEVNAVQAIVKAIGFNPQELTAAYEARSTAKDFESKIRTRRENLLAGIFIANSKGDMDTLQEKLEQVQRFNSKHPQYQITPQTIQSSMKARSRNVNESWRGVSLTKGLRPDIMDKVAGYQDLIGD